MAEAGTSIPALGVILAGGRGRRMGGVDKGLIDFQGRPLAAQVLERLRPQVQGVAICANRHAERYAAFGAPVFADDHPFEGPLAGLQAALRRLPDTMDWIWLVPCDAPALPADLAAALWSARGAAPAVLPRTPDGHAHPTHALAHRALLPALDALLATPGPRGAAGWLFAQGAVALAWPTALPGFNTPAEVNNAQVDGRRLTP